MPCAVIESLPRLLRSAYHPEMRLVVWKRLQRQELLWVERRDLARIEAYAATCNMPLVR